MAGPVKLKNSFSWPRIHICMFHVYDNYRSNVLLEGAYGDP
jgi:hypothetical protein